MKLISILVFILVFFILSFCQETSIDSPKNKLEAVDKLDKVEILIQLANETVINNHEKCVGYCKEALSIIEDDKSQLNKIAEIHTILCSAYYYSCDYNSSLENGNKALQLYKNLKDPDALANSYKWMGMISQVVGNYDPAISYISKALELHTNLKDDSAICYDYYFLGIINMFKNNYLKNLEYNLIALKLVDSLRIPDLTLKSRILNQIGRSYELQKDYEKALDFFNESMIPMKEMENLEGIANRLHSIAMLYDKIGNQEKAVPLLEEALEILIRIENRLGIAYTYQNLGIVQFNNKQFTKSGKYFQLCLPLFSEFGIQFGLATVYVYLARINIEKNQLDKAESDAFKGMKIAEKIHQKGLIREALLVMSEINFKNQN